MTLQTWPGNGVQWPNLSDALGMSPQYVTMLIDATGEKAAVVGRVKWADRGTHDVRSVGWRAGAIVSAGGSGIVTSLQDVHTTTGNPPRPDETQDQTIGALLSALAANAWNTQTFSADRAGVAHNDLLAVVWEYDGSGRLGADSLQVSSLFAGGASSRSMLGALNVLLTASWALQSSFPTLVLIGADGAIGTLGFGAPWSLVNTHTFNNSSTPDERANQFVLATPATIEGVTLPIGVVDAADVSVILYTGTTATETIAFDEDSGPFDGTSVNRMHHFAFNTPRDLLAGTTYRIGVQPNTANDITIFSFDVAAASYLALFGGEDMHYWDRVDAGAWDNETLTRCLAMKLHFSKTGDDTGGGGGGGGLLRANMSGGLL